MLVAKVRMLNCEEDRVAEVEEVSLLKVDPVQARLAPSLADLSMEIARFAAFVANIASEDLDSEQLTPYKFREMAQQFTKLQEQQMLRAFERWHSALVTVRTSVEGVIPTGWRSLVVDEYDPACVKEHLLVQSFISGLGSDYVPAATWLNQLEEKVQPLHVQYVERYKQEHDQCIEIFKDSKDICACILAYNCLVNKRPKAKSADNRRQDLKDLRNKVAIDIG